MLFLIGVVAITVAPFNFHEQTSSSEASFAEKAVVGRRQILEAVGEGAQTQRFSGRIFPQKLGGLGELEMMQQQQSAQEAIPVMRGDGVPLGWYVITQIDVKSQRFDAQGLGRYLEIEVTLRRSDPPSAAGVFGLLSSLFG
jgi:phage protein U